MILHDMILSTTFISEKEFR